jgi:hypothetical protein
MLSVESRLSRRWSLRLDGEWSLLHGPPPQAGREGDSRYRDLRTYGASLNGLRRFSEGRFAPYLLAGIGAYRLQRVGDYPSVYGTTGALQVGVGIDGDLWGRVNPFVEARALVHATDYGAVEYGPTIVWPVLIGVRIR